MKLINEIDKLTKNRQVQQLNELLNAFIKPKINLKKFVKFDIKDLDAKHQKEIKDSFKQLEGILDSLDIISEEILYNENNR